MVSCSLIKKKKKTMSGGILKERNFSGKLFCRYFRGV